MTKITITLSDEGGLNVTTAGAQGENILALLGMIEMGKNLLLANHQKPASPATSPILLAKGALPVNGR